MLHRSDRTTLCATFDLLKGNVALSEKVKTIRLIKFEDASKKRTKGWLDIGSFVGMLQLRSLSMTRPRFKTKTDQTKFLAALKRSCKLLKEVIY